MSVIRAMPPGDYFLMLSVLEAESDALDEMKKKAEQ